ncbi:hypothetical protein AC579_560 [Pseudocercospora musae]|uniref:Methyltransferase type 11 domain-containing protein n=1 Tax=Pseudocercospora musae TaxID=113226 RepID=A0A139IRT6_9PEZI|nr:hypothetical protein AC579_560 [Pseudocercospora musae]
MGILDWTRFFKHSWDFLEPGGWLEINETRFPQLRAEEDNKDDLPEGPFMRWSRLCYEAALKVGINAPASEGLASLLEKQDFSNVESVDIKWPIGSWAVGPTEKKIVLQEQLGMSTGVKDCSEHRFYVEMVLDKAQKPSA